MPSCHWVEEIFKKREAIRNGHFVLASGRHSGEYLDKAMIFPFVLECRNICLEISQMIRLNNIEVEAVVGPAYGGIVLSNNTAYFLGSLCGKQVLALFTEKDEKNKQVLKRGYGKLLAGKNVLVVDDILTTGGSIKQVIKEVNDAGGLVVAVAVICNRGGVNPEDIDGYPLFSLWDKAIESWEPDNCPLCKEGIPLENPKSR